MNAFLRSDCMGTTVSRMSMIFKILSRFGWM